MICIGKMPLMLMLVRPNNDGAGDDVDDNDDADDNETGTDTDTDDAATDDDAAIKHASITCSRKRNIMVNKVALTT